MKFTSVVAFCGERGGAAAAESGSRGLRRRNPGFKRRRFEVRWRELPIQLHATTSPVSAISISIRSHQKKNSYLLHRSSSTLSSIQTNQPERIGERECASHLGGGRFGSFKAALVIFKPKDRNKGSVEGDRGERGFAEGWVHLGFIVWGPVGEITRMPLSILYCFTRLLLVLRFCVWCI